MIDGVSVISLKKVCNEQGCVFHMLKRTDPVFREFGEIYFTSVNPGIIKGWTIHKEADINLACPRGRVKCVLIDMRANSATKDAVEEIMLGEDDYVLLHVPCGVAVAFKGLSENPALLANCSTLPHAPDEMIKIDPRSGEIGYKWE